MTDTTPSTNPPGATTLFPSCVTDSSPAGTDTPDTGPGSHASSSSAPHPSASPSPHSPAPEDGAGGPGGDPRVGDLSRRVTQVRAAHEQDIAAIGAALLREAADRGWCEDYDRVVAALNDDLHVPLPVRLHTYEVTFDLRVSIQVEASTHDQARECAADLVNRIEDEVADLDDVTGCIPDHPGDFDIAT